MKKRISFLLAAVLLLATLIPALPVLADGEEAVANTFNVNDTNPTISTAADYMAFFEAAFKTGVTGQFEGRTVTLLHDITFNDTTVADWYKQENAVKLDYSNTNWLWFRGTFDGGNHTLKGVIVDGSFRDGQAGLFPYAAFGASIKNLTVDGFYVCGRNTANDPIFARAGIGGLIGCVKENLTIDNITMKNGIVTCVEGGKGALGALIGTYANDGVKNAKLSINNCTIEESVRVLKGASDCAFTSGLIGYIEGGFAAHPSFIDVTGSVLQASGSMDAAVTLKPLGIYRFKGANDPKQGATWYVENSSNGYKQGVPMNTVTTVTNPLGDNHFAFADYTESYNQAIIDSGCYGASAIPTVKLVGVQRATDGSNDLRFVGMIKKVDLDLITALGFEITVGDKTVGTDEIKCTGLYESIKENGNNKAAPEGYYFFTFVVTDVADGTAFTVKACTTVDGKVCATTAGAYTHTRAAS